MQPQAHLADLGHQVDLRPGEHLTVRAMDDACYLLLWGSASIVIDGSPLMHLSGGSVAAGAAAEYALVAEEPSVVLRVPADGLDALVDSTPGLAGSLLVRIHRFAQFVTALGDGS